ncbi:MarR family transcriptional regulator [Priestia aryabhattai]|uniref:MarR family winged helix-turn-helix transcriptional regulator n=1 Tax=Bacillaceae TaxID=186817 RepID=UPI000BA0F5AB|nr:MULTISPECIES: MarR family transcriptional regulator [Bacillaceae]MDT2047426.1 MarR family transcriptional regulator [Priestia flexa]OZT14025.1 MarR family transcriptional regulator [Priestia aryabhattai]TDB55170.1 MarR family transcriptional regulator [Bacillus sp. CBEL-1]USY56450.1 MarR family transcriptional regulator [Bacillus sp. 1780r2a1]
MNKESYKLDDSLGYRLFHASRLMMNRLNHHFKNNDYPLTYEQWQIMSRLYEKDGQTQNQLAIQNERDQASVSRLIDNMIKRELVKRVPHITDRRINLIYLTEYGKSIQVELEKLAQQTISDASEGLTEEELAICLSTLNKIRYNLR